MVQRRTTPRRVGVPRAAATAAKASIKAKAKPRAKAKPKAKPVTPRRSQRRAPSSEAEAEPEPESEPENAESDAEQQQQQEDEDDDTDHEEEEDGDAALFLEALARDAQRKPPVPPRAFELPFSASEIANIEARELVHRPPHYGKITKCVIVSKPAPPADLPVLKCNCFAETKHGTTKREAQIATAKALLANGGKRRLRGASAAKKPSETNANATAALLCGDNCYNRMLFISCSEDTCSAPDPALCSNRAIKRREVKSVRVEYIPGPGFGLFSNGVIRAGEFVIEYVGEVIDDEECERRMIQCRDRGETHFYMLELDKDTLIDARYRSNESRFINHSCDPNCMTQKWNVGGVLRIGIFARRTIRPDEEITIDYNFSHFGEAVDCKCGSAACTGKIGRKRAALQLVKGVPKAQHRQLEAQELVPPEIERPVTVSSLVLLKTAQLDTEWLDTYGYKKRRLFLGRATPAAKRAKVAEPSDDGSTDTSGQTSAASSSSSPVSEWSLSSSTDDDADAARSAAAAAAAKQATRAVKKSNWYARMKAGKHLPEMRTRHSYICSGRADWSKDLAALPKPKPKPKAVTTSPARAKQHKKRDKRSLAETVSVVDRPAAATPAMRAASGVRLARFRPTRLGLLEARERLFAELKAFARGASKWNARIPSARSVDPNRITRFVQQTQKSVRYSGKNLNDLNEDACHRCGLSGELICCDGCPAAFHLNCTNLQTLPPAKEHWFCAECTNPRKQADGRAARRQSRSQTPTAAASSSSGAPSVKRLFFSTAQQQQKRKHRKRARGAQQQLQRSYRLLESAPLPSVSDSE